MATDFITKETAVEVRNRDGHRCKHPDCIKILIFGSDNLETKGELHHCYWKSQYRGKDRNQPRNLDLVCSEHHRGSDGVHGGNTELDEQCKKEADKRKPKEERSKEKVKKIKHCATEEEKEKARKFARIRRESQIENFKKNNGGLTPSQYAYRKNKQYLLSSQKY